MAGGLAAAACFALAGGLLGFLLGRRGWGWAVLGLLLILGATAAALHLAAKGAEGMRSLAYAAVMTAVALPAMAGAAIGGLVGWWRRRGAHGA